ncbi:MAG: peptide-methionine (R)-S-oxide reductase [Planctomycetota bacterium]|nr:MAG: peptide-methionine (R)-S-oxide reductase [Planctomycetota bacterium]
MPGTKQIDKLVLSEEDWQQKLSPEQFHILREEGTEQAFTGRYWDTQEDGIYHCAGCDLALFDSATKFKSGTGWPSFWKPIDPAHILENEDRKLFVLRTEVLCARCDGHLGHVFDDGPQPTGLRYCLNSAALMLKKP